MNSQSREAGRDARVDDDTRDHWSVGPILKLPRRSGLTLGRAAQMALLVAAGLFVRWLLLPVLDQHATYLTIYPVIALAAVLWGKVPGAAVGALGHQATEYLFVDPTWHLHLTPAALVSLLIVVGSAIFLGHVGDRWRASEAALRVSATEARAVEAALRESEARYRTLFTAMNEGFQLCELIYDEQGRANNFRFLEVNPAFERHTGLTREQVVGHTIREVAPDIEPHWLNACIRVAETREPQRQESFEKTSNRWYDVNIFSPAAGRFAATLVDVSERKRTEDALRKSEASLKELAESLARSNEQLTRSQEQYRLLNQATHDVIWDWNLTSNTIFWNESIEAAFGYRMADVSHDFSWWHEHVHPDDAERVTNSLSTALADPAVSSWTAEYRFRHRDGHWIDLLDRGFVIRDTQGRAVRMLGSILDVAARKEAERRFWRVLETCPMGALLAEINGRVVYANDAYLRMIGRSREQLEHSEVFWNQITPSEYLAKDDRAIQQALSCGVSDMYEKEYVKPDGQRIPVLLACASVGGNELAAFTLDITERKKAELALQASEAKLRAVFRSLTEAVLFINTEGMVEEANDAAQAYANSVEELAALVLEHRSRIIRSDGSPFPVDEQPSNVALRTGEAVRGVEMGVPCTDGKIRWQLVNAQPVRNDDGNVLGAVASFFDITDRKTVERALKEANEQLEEADRRKNDFLAVLSHELRNPLAPICNSLYILDRAPPGRSSAKHAYEVIGRQVTHMTKLIDDLLDVTRVSRGKVRLQRERVDLCALVVRTAEDQQSLFANGGIHFDIQTCEPPLFVYVDPTRLSQVVGNLLTNAAKFTPRGGRVSLSLTAEEGSVTLRVQDTGAGIPAHLQKKLFEPFVQADATLDRSKGGLGLGLALVKGLVELHGGSVTVHSEGPGTGAEFIVRLPMDQPEVPLSQLPEIRSRSGKGNGLRVLIVEDNLDAAESLKELLELEGHEVSLANGGAEGIEMARANNPDVVLCDIGLPYVDGYEVARAIRADSTLQSIFLVALSGYASHEDVVKAKEAGFDQHMAKPPNIPALIKLLAGVPAPTSPR